MSYKTTVKRDHSRKFILPGLTLAAALTVARPLIPTKVYAAGNTYNWVKQGDLDKLGSYFTSSAISGNGSHMILGVEWGGEGQGFTSPLFVTQDAGATWTDVRDEVEEDIRNGWSSVDISNNGQVMVAASDWRKEVDANELEGKIHKSEDGGATWEDISPVTSSDNDRWEKVAVSGNGSKIVAVSDSEKDTVYYSSNGGDSWSTSTVEEVDAWHSVSVSDDGSKVLVGGEAADESAFVYFSDNGGANWDDVAPIPLEDVAFWVTTDISGDGEKIVVSSYGYNDEESGSVEIGAISVSESDGVTWTDATPESDEQIDWADVALSDDGAVIMAASWDGYTFVTTNDGTNWNEEDPGYVDDDTNYWRSVDLNSDGTKAIINGTENAYIGDGDPNSGSSSADLVDAESGKAILITTPDGTTITCHSAVKESALSAQDSSYTYPLGLVDFCFDTDQESNAVTLTFVTDLKPNEAVIRKYNPTTKVYSNLSDASVTETTYNNQHALQVTYTIVDNGPLDLDPDEGQIADPVGVGVSQSLASTGQSSTEYVFLASALIATGFGMASVRKQKK